MKKLLTACLLATLFGCATNRTLYTTIASTQQAVKLAYDGYIDSVIAGQTRTNELPAISASFNAFEASVIVAADTAGTNGVASADLANAASSILNAINKVKGNK